MSGPASDPDLPRLAAAVVLPGFHGTTVPAWLRDRLEQGLAGVCLFGQNVTDPAQVRTLTAALHEARPAGLPGVLVASDEEGGSVTRLDAPTGSPWPAHAALGALDDPRTTERVARDLGARARALGVDLVLAPVVDVGSEPDNPVIGERSFGADPALVSRHGAAFVRGLQAGGVAACAKHFPGHGATRTDSHLALPVVDVDEATYRARDLAPFGAVVDAGTRCVMTAHVVVTALDDQPATMSAPVLALLRDELGFDGCVVSDALDMRAVADGVGRAAGAVRAMAAGVDLLCIGNPAFPDPYDDEAAVAEVVGALVDAVEAGDLPVERLRAAVERVAGLAAWVAAAPTTEACDDASALRHGAEVADRVLAVRGDVRLDGPALVLLARPELSYAAGHRPSPLLALLGEQPGWETVEVADPAEATERASARGARDVVVLTEARAGEATRAVVDAVLVVAPDAVVVHAGLAGPAPHEHRSLHTHGGGAAGAVAVARRLGQEAP